jgi:2-iminobutanoate/2-iminopropanoate deaminase
MTRRSVSTSGAPRTGLPYAQAIQYGDLVYVSGQVAIDPSTGQAVEGDVRVQTRRVLDNINAILQAAGTSLEYSVEALCFLADAADFAAFNEVYASYFPDDPPARTTVQAALPLAGLKVEIRVIAGVPSAS